MGCTAQDNGYIILINPDRENPRWIKSSMCQIYHGKSAACVNYTQLLRQ